METFSFDESDGLLQNIFAVCYTGKIDRYKRLCSELNRVGVGNPYVIWMYPSPYRKFLLDRIPHSPQLENIGCWGATIGHYRAMKIAFELGLDHVLICEDDIRFLKDIDRIKSTMSNVPADWDLLFLDSFFRAGEQQTGYKGWGKLPFTQSSGCYIINRRTMKRLIGLYEAPISETGEGVDMVPSDCWFNESKLGNGYNMYVANPNLAIQGHDPLGNNCGEVIQNAYTLLNLDMKDYAEW